MSFLPAIVTLLTIALLFATVFATGRARTKYGIKAPATSGHPQFERAYRVQMNTLEQAVLFLPTLWLAARYGHPGWAGGLGFIWVAGRIWYALAYWRDPARRGPGFITALASCAALFVVAVIGVGQALLAA